VLVRAALAGNPQRTGRIARASVDDARPCFERRVRDRSSSRDDQTNCKRKPKPRFAAPSFQNMLEAPAF
jgi:hypothetical protein